MSPEERRQVAKVFAGLSYYYHRQQLPDGVLALYVADVDDLPCARVLGALEALRRDPKRRAMPLPADVRQRVAPDPEQNHEAQANMIAGKIVAAVSRYGYMNAKGAREHLGEVAWRVIQAKGGWQNICGTLTASDNSFYAQCRDLARSFLAMRQHEPEGPLLEGGRHFENAIQDGCRGDNRHGITPASETLGALMQQLKDKV